jgi:uncharacterized membrane protein YqjE
LKEVQMSDTRHLSTPELLRGITEQLQLLVKTHVELAKTELRTDLKRESRTAARLGISALAALTAINLLLVTAVLALATVLPGWAAGLIVTGLVILAGAIVGAVGWTKRVRQPLARTRHALNQDWTFTKRELGRDGHAQERRG